uniref:Neuroendocrine protein 7B2 n=1 Tax=Eptatretus burgeri TaxID=7764 RepID=A0A8C4NJG0_EPTBU
MALCSLLVSLVLMGSACTSPLLLRTDTARPDWADEKNEGLRRFLFSLMEEMGIAQPRVEFAAHQAGNVLGPQHIQGGAHEGFQHLGPFGNIPNVIAEIVGDDRPLKLNADHRYPNPPNPCPLGKSALDGCLERMPDTAEFSHNYQQNQNHFNPRNYPRFQERSTLTEDAFADPEDFDMYNPYLNGQKLENLVAKKSAHDEK